MSPRGFTVMMLTAVLVGGAFVYLRPSGIKPPINRRTLHLVHDVKLAVEAYYLEYNRVPVSSDGEGDAEIRFDGSSEGRALLMLLTGGDMAKGSGSSWNGREIVFFDTDLSKEGSIGIVLEGDVAVKLLDAWGQPIRVVIDTNHDGKIWDPDPRAKGEFLEERIAVWSEGNPKSEDGKSPWENNVRSWQ